MSLKTYYEKLKRETPPKTAFVEEIAQRCAVNETTVRNWIKYGMKPSNPAHIDILSELTGIAKDKLWN